MKKPDPGEEQGNHELSTFLAKVSNIHREIRIHYEVEDPEKQNATQPSSQFVAKSSPSLEKAHASIMRRRENKNPSMLALRNQESNRS